VLLFIIILSFTDLLSMFIIKSQVPISNVCEVDSVHLFLKEKARYTSATGRKSISENYAYLPSTLSGMSDNGTKQVSKGL